ncbi:MAG TPA: hypothetical protein VFL17_05400 [Anaerolineae bacterium]|nr:hypothetical protein [Anaerolineae bacterium]
MFSTRTPAFLVIVLLLAVTLAVVWGAASAGPTTPPRVAYIYDTDTASRDSFDAMLTSRGFTVDLVPLGSAASYDFSPDEVIIVGNDTGTAGNWDAPDAIANVDGAGKPIVGVGEGGSSFFDDINIFIDWGQSWSASGDSVYVVDPANLLWSTPIPISIPGSNVVKLYTQASPYRAVDNPTLLSNVVRIGRQVDDAVHYPIISESVRTKCYALWGFYNSPAAMTADGQDLFVNILLGRPCDAKANNTPTPTSQLPACQELVDPFKLPSPALINFDDLTHGQVIGTAYQAAYGVTFENSPTTRAIIYGNEPAEAQSKPNVATNDAVFPETSNDVPMNLGFSSPKTHVGFYIGNGEFISPTAMLTAYDAFDHIICQVRNTPVPEPHTEFIGVYDPTGRIVRISLDYGNTSLSESIDDLYFAPAPGGPGPAPTRTPMPTWTPIPSPTPTSGPTATPMPVIPVYPYVPPVIIAPIIPPVGDLSIHGIEITQGIQCFNPAQGLASCPDNSLPLVAKKDATARIYLKLTGGASSSLSNVPVRLHIFANGVEYIGNASGKATGSINQANDDSADIYFNVNFSNDVLVSFYAVVDESNTIAETNESNNRYPASGTISLNFRKRDTLKVVGQRVRYHPSGYSGTQYAGGWAVNGGAADWWEQMLPIRNNGINYSVASGYLNWTKMLTPCSSDTGSNNQHDLIQKLNTQWFLQNVFSWLFGTTFTGADHVYGWVPDAGYPCGHADMPVYPHAGGFGVVGIGTDAPGASTDNPGAGALIFGHELTHDYDVKHTDTGADDCGSNDSSSDFPYGTSSIQEFGFNPITGKIYNPASTHDLMSYCPAGGSKEGWISPFTWNRMSSDLDALALLAASSAQAGRPYAFNVTSSSESLVVDATIFNPDVVGTVSGTLGSLHRVSAGLAYPLPAGDYAVELRSGATALISQTFSVSFESEYSAHSGPNSDPPTTGITPTTQADITFVMPWADGATSVVLLYNNQVLDSRAVSANAPNVTITSPTQVVTWTTGTQTVAWTASDLDGDPLTYSVLYSHDAGASWELLAEGLTNPSFSVDADSLAGGSDARIRVVATDGVNIGYDETDAPIVVPDKAPYALITNPVSGQIIAPGNLLVLQGTGTDLEDGGLPDSALHWSSSRDGSLGDGPSLGLTSLSRGPHVITLTVMDSHGQTTSVSVSIFVGHGVYLPVVLK